MQTNNTVNKQLQFNFPENNFTEQLNFSSLLREQPITTLLYSGSPMITLLEQPDNCDNALDQVRIFYHLLELIKLAGHLEHTGDYDPFLIITLKDGTEIETNNHYFTFEISEDEESILLEDYSDLIDEDEEDEDYYKSYPTSILIKDIHSIQLIPE